MYFTPDAQPTLLQLTHMVTPSGKEVKIIQNIVAKWEAVGIHFNFDPTGYTIDLIDARHSSKPMACCTDMMKMWLGGRGRKPTSWPTLVKVLRNAEFYVLADEVEQLVPMSIESGGEEEEEGGETVTVEENTLHPTNGVCAVLLQS